MANDIIYIYIYISSTFRKDVNAMQEILPFAFILKFMNFVQFCTID